MLNRVKTIIAGLVWGVIVVLVGSTVVVNAAEGETYPKTSETEVETNNNRNEANVVKPNETITGNITSRDDDYFRFVFPSDGLLNVNLFRTSTYENSYQLVIYDERLNSIYENRIGAYSFDLPLLNYKKETVLYFRISGYWRDTDYSQTENYELTFSYKEASDWEYGNNENKNEATPLKEKTYGTIMTSGDVDYYSFVPSKNGYVDFSFVNEDGLTDTYGWDITLYDEKLTKLYTYEISTDNTLGTYSCKKKTPIYIKIEKHGSEVINATYSIEPLFKAVNSEIEPNGSEANKIKLNTVYYGTLLDTDDVDYYKFKATKSGKYKLIYDMDGIDEKYRFYSVSVLDAEKKEIINLQLHEDGTAKFDVKKGKTYYICVKQGNKGTSIWGSSVIHLLYKIRIKTK